jgi:hypothetical protein
VVEKVSNILEEYTASIYRVEVIRLDERWFIGKAGQELDCLETHR